MNSSTPAAPRVSMSEFVKTHCKICAAGWVRTGQEGAEVIVCLLDREPVKAGLTGCNRFELPEEEPLKAIRWHPEPPQNEQT